MTYKVEKLTRQGDAITSALSIDIITLDTEEALKNTLDAALDDHQSSSIGALEITAYASKDAIRYSGWMAKAYQTVTGDRFYDFDNDPEIRRFLFEGNQ